MEIVISDIGVDFLYQFADAAKGAAPNCLLGDEPEPALHLVEPTCVSGGVVEVIAGVAGKDLTWKTEIRGNWHAAHGARHVVRGTVNTSNGQYEQT